MKKILKFLIIILATISIFGKTFADNVEDNNYVKVDSQINGLKIPSQYKNLSSALKHAKNGDVIIFEEGVYDIDRVNIDKKNITITSEYILDGDKKHINNTILKGKGSSRTKYLYGLKGKSENLRVIGITFKDMYKPIVFNAYGEVHYSKFLSTKRRMGDAISFETHAVGGVVTNCYTKGTGDESVDIDSSRGGLFIIAHNEFYDGHDDSIEIRSFKYKGSDVMRYKIHDNIISGFSEDGIQLIDHEKGSNREFDIYRNIIENNKMAGIGCMSKGNTIENYKGNNSDDVVKIYNNYFNNNNYDITGNNEMLVLNNIFSNARKLSVYKLKSNSIADYNLFFKNKKNMESSITGKHNIFNINPQVDYDFRPKKNSPIIDSGVKEFQWKKRKIKFSKESYLGKNPDIGRFEFNGNVNFEENKAPKIINLNDIILKKSEKYIKVDPKITDDGLPNNKLKYRWRDIKGTGNVKFSNYNGKNIKISFSEIGDYFISLTVDDGDKKTEKTFMVKYVSDGNNEVINFKKENIKIESEKYSLLYGNAMVVKDNSASGKKALTNNDSDLYRVNYLLKTIKDKKFNIKLRVKNTNKNKESIVLKFYGSEGIKEIKKTIKYSSKYQDIEFLKEIYATPGVWKIELLVSGNIYFDNILLYSNNDANNKTIISKIKSSYDDVEEKKSGRIYYNSTDLELVKDKKDQKIGLRFTGLNIPKNAIITNAYIQFQTDEKSKEYTKLKISIEDNDEPLIFTRKKYNVSNRKIFSDNIKWKPEKWMIRGERSKKQQTPNLSKIVQKIIDKYNKNIDSVVFIISGKGKRVAESYDGKTFAPELHIEYKI